jgi:flagellar biosynthesis protein FliQ
MSWTATLVSLAAGLAIATFCGWRGAQAPNLIRGPRLIPYRLIMVLSSAWIMLMLVHVVNLLGFTTGR